MSSILVAALLGLAPVAQSQRATEAEADSLFAVHQWEKAAASYRVVTGGEPGNGRAWFRLGSCLHTLGDYDGAVDAYRRAAGIGGNPVVMYNLACAFSLSGKRDSAIAWLARGADAGFHRVRDMNEDADLASLRADARFGAILDKVTANAHPCSSQALYHQFDFWVGEWDVTAQGRVIATSSIQHAVDGCVVLEHYEQADGYSGRSINFVDPPTRRWRQVWVDRTGTMSEFSGEFRDGAMHLQGTTHRTNGTTVLRTMRLNAMGADTVRQYSESSTDGGATWTTAYDFLYIRRRGTP